MPSSRTYSPSSRAGSVSRLASVPPRTTTQTMALRISSRVMSLFSPWNIMQVRMKYTQPSSGTSQGCFNSWTATGSLRFVFFAMFFSFSP